MKNPTSSVPLRLTATALAAFGIAAVPAHAQYAPSNDASASNWTPDIVVVGQREQYAEPGSAAATKTDTPRIQVPQSVQVLTGALLRDQDRRQLGEALANVSGVVGNRPEEGLTVGPLVRGFLAEIYQDGLPMFGAFSAVNDPASLVGIRRIEVLKGPTATLYGGGVGSPLGGLIHVESERPGTELQGYAAIRAGSFATFNPYGELDVPITTRISARVAAEYQGNDHWIDRIKGERIFVQPSIAFRLGARTDLMVQGQYGRREQLEYSGLPAAHALAGTVDPNAFPGAPNDQPRSTVTNRMVTGTLRHGFADDVRLTVTGRYYDSRVPQFGTFLYPDLYPAAPATPTRYPLLALNMLSHFEEATFDANLVAKTEMFGGTHTFLAGASYDHTDLFGYGLCRGASGLDRLGRSGL
ncbi:TonB-dependent siderophore receptor [Sphingomonas sp. Leaf4]|uniref:TonB-dependent siderophore receptor n=1 Tax=Sphingomonas sp. Leaf4 TaxID=2876553 RepID=UPI001E5E9A57|nr:TonB-dependent receptor plug domain-containing protein [Sphingomonas sp. Leaf4]